MQKLLSLQMTINLIMLRVGFGANSTVTSEVFYDSLDQLSKSQVLTHGKFFLLKFLYCSILCVNFFNNCDCSNPDTTNKTHSNNNKRAS